MLVFFFSLENTNERNIIISHLLSFMIESCLTVEEAKENEKQKNKKTYSR